MIDGTGMCGGCRVLIDGKSEFACVDGPEFDAHKVNFEFWCSAMECIERRSSGPWPNTSALKRRVMGAEEHCSNCDRRPE